MRKLKTAEFGILDSTLEFGILKLGYLTALHTYLVMVCVPVVGLFVLRRIGELMLDDKFGVDEQNDGIVQGGPAYAELFMLDHPRIKRIYIKMPVDRINCIEYRKSFRCFPMPIRIEVLRKNLPYRIFYFLTFHNRGHFFKRQQS